MMRADGAVGFMAQAPMTNAARAGFDPEIPVLAGNEPVRNGMRE